MKIKLLLLFTFFLNMNLIAQERKTEKYDFKYVYYIITDNKTNIKKELPKGSDAIITYDTFYKKYYALWTDEKNVRAGVNFYHMDSNNDMTLVKDDNEIIYYVTNEIKKYDKLFFTMKNYVNDKIITIYFTNEMLK